MVYIVRMRMNIYVPDDLRKRMDKASRRQEVNWSAIACRAFLDQVIQHEMRQQRTRMERTKVIERLKAADADVVSESERVGNEDGQRWAEQFATPTQLRRLKDAQHGSKNWYIGVGGSAYSAAEGIYFTIEPGHDGVREEADGFWEKYGRLTPDNVDAYVLGFCKGAMEVWDQVSHQL